VGVALSGCLVCTSFEGVTTPSLFGGWITFLPCMTFGCSGDVIEIALKPFCKFIILMTRR
jgi:hypothetical protein